MFYTMHVALLDFTSAFIFIILENVLSWLVMISFLQVLTIILYIFWPTVRTLVDMSEFNLLQMLYSTVNYNYVNINCNFEHSIGVSKMFPGMDEEVRLSYQDQLVDCIMWVLVSHDYLHYYQVAHLFSYYRFLSLQWFTSYLSSCIAIQPHFFPSSPLSCGIPQNSVLSLILFMLYIIPHSHYFVHCITPKTYNFLSVIPINFSSAISDLQSTVSLI